ncbi:hypothetical protein APHAL10511_000261 [Amanita phalloides]|nr:hypothetical protein APHAL10511_000261 [Amanita phalloides]
MTDLVHEVEKRHVRPGAVDVVGKKGKCFTTQRIRYWADERVRQLLTAKRVHLSSVFEWKRTVSVLSPRLHFRPRGEHVFTSSNIFSPAFRSTVLPVIRTRAQSCLVFSSFASEEKFPLFSSTFPVLRALILLDKVPWGQVINCLHKELALFVARFCFQQTANRSSGIAYGCWERWKALELWLIPYASPDSSSNSMNMLFLQMLLVSAVSRECPYLEISKPAKPSDLFVLKSSFYGRCDAQGQVARTMPTMAPFINPRGAFRAIGRYIPPWPFAQFQ